MSFIVSPEKTTFKGVLTCSEFLIIIMNPNAYSKFMIEPE